MHATEVIESFIDDTVRLLPRRQRRRRRRAALSLD